MAVGDYDFTPCGGTHCTRSAQVGPVHVSGIEGYKGKVRVSFTAGKRTRAELWQHAGVLRELGKAFTCGPWAGGCAREPRAPSPEPGRDGDAASWWPRRQRYDVLSPEDGLVEIAYGVEQDSQRQGYATEGTRASVEWALAQPGVRAVRATTPTWHASSRRVLEKCSFTGIGSRESDAMLGELLEFERRG